MDVVVVAAAPRLQRAVLGPQVERWTKETTSSVAEDVVGQREAIVRRHEPTGEHGLLVIGVQSRDAEPVRKDRE